MHIVTIVSSAQDSIVSRIFSLFPEIILCTFSRLKSKYFFKYFLCNFSRTTSDIVLIHILKIKSEHIRIYSCETKNSFSTWTCKLSRSISANENVFDFDKRPDGPSRTYFINPFTNLKLQIVNDIIMRRIVHG